MPLNGTQLKNAAIIVKIGKDLGATRDQIIAALSGAWVESRLGILDGGDNGTAWGLFQQRHVSGWGTKSQSQDPYFATTAFYQGVNGHRGLLDVWSDSRTPGLNVQKVQNSAHPYRYDGAISFAKEILRQIEGIVGTLPDEGAAGGDTTISRGISPGGGDAEPTRTTSPLPVPRDTKNKGLQSVLVLTVGLVLIILAGVHMAK